VFHKGLVREAAGLRTHCRDSARPHAFQKLGRKSASVHGVHCDDSFGIGSGIRPGPAVTKRGKIDYSGNAYES
jgi:hypothetical protein